MVLLTATTHTLEVDTSTAASLDYYVSYVDITTSAFTPDISKGNIASITTTTVLSAPGSSTQRQVKFATFRNRSTTSSNTIVVKLDVSGTETYLTSNITLLPGEVLSYAPDDGFQIKDSSGRPKIAATDYNSYNGYSSSFYKVGTTTEAAGQWYSWAKDSGFPGAWAPGSPGVAGRITSGNLNPSSDGGSLVYPEASSGSLFVNRLDVAGSVAGYIMVHDILWVNSGITVTTTTAQTINSKAFPSRDINATSNGAGCWAGILVTTATTNVGAVTNTTLTYTNSAGTGSRTATIASFPATAVAGTVVWFQLQAGDIGIQSIQSVTLGTSYGGGAISLIVTKPIIAQANIVANIGGLQMYANNPGVKIQPGSTLLLIGIASATTAVSLAGNLTILER